MYKNASTPDMNTQGDRSPTIASQEAILTGVEVYMVYPDILSCVSCAQLLCVIHTACSCPSDW